MNHSPSSSLPLAPQPAHFGSSRCAPSCAPQHATERRFILRRGDKYTVTKDQPRFEAAHIQKFNYLGDPKEHTKKCPDRVHILSCVFDLNAINEVREWKQGGVVLAMSDADSEEYAKRQVVILAAQIALAEFAKECAARSRKVKKSDCLTA